MITLHSMSITAKCAFKQRSRIISFMVSYDLYQYQRDLGNGQNQIISSSCPSPRGLTPFMS